MSAAVELAIQTWEAYTPAARRRVLADLGPVGRSALSELPSGACHIGLLQGEPRQAFAALATAIEQRGGLVRRRGDTWLIAGSLGAWAHGIAALRRSGEACGWELARRVDAALNEDSGRPAKDMPCRDLSLITI